jgi:hypothetical protein
MLLFVVVVNGTPLHIRLTRKSELNRLKRFDQTELSSSRETGEQTIQNTEPRFEFKDRNSTNAAYCRLLHRGDEDDANWNDHARRASAVPE